MPSGSYSENSYENAVIEVLKNACWGHIYGPDLTDRDYRDPTQYDVLRYQHQKGTRIDSEEAER